MTICVEDRLAAAPVSASAPCRIDAGGTWDIKAMALPLERLEPITINIALDLRTTVRLEPYRAGRVRIESQNFSEGVEAVAEHLPLCPPFGAYCAAVAFFGLDGLAVTIESGSPVKAALGGSSSALVALIRALAQTAPEAGRFGRFTRTQILHLAYHLEDAMQGGCGGMQDQAAAVYGGVHAWDWSYSRSARPWARRRLLDRVGSRALDENLLVAFCGRTHVSAVTNRQWIEAFLQGRTRDGWIAANRLVRRLAVAIQALDWAAAAECLRRETALRRHITPEALIPETDFLIEQAEAAGCGARFAGAGAGGSLWALGPKGAINQLKDRWRASLEEMPGGCLLDCRVALEGVRLEVG